jgi:hypothetical protein
MAWTQGSDEGEYSVAVTGPGGEWAWTGYADNRTDALAKAENAVGAEQGAFTPMSCPDVPFTVRDFAPEGMQQILIELEPGETVGPTGVINGAGAHPDIPRFGADENDLD